MYIFFALYLVLLISIRSLLKQKAPGPAQFGIGRIAKVTVGSIAIGGGLFIAIAVAASMLFGIDGMRQLVSKMIYVVPAIALIAAPFVSRKMR